MNKKIRVMATLLALGVVCGASSFKSKAATVDAVDVVEEKVPLAVEATGEGEIFRKVDNSQNIYFPPIIEQGKYNSCASWAMTYYQTSYEINRIEGKDGSLKENQLSPVFTYNLTNNGKNEGTYFTDVAKVLKEVGSVSMDVLPADTTNGDMPIGDISANKDIWRDAHKNRIKEYVAVSNGGASRQENILTPITGPQDEDLNEMKAALSQGYILTASTPGNKWKYQNIETNPEVPENDAYAGEQVMSICDREGYRGHRITVVGYNDDIWVDINQNGQVEEAEKGAFKIANTRGTEYGNDGYMWVSYDTLNVVSACTQDSKVDLGFFEREVSLVDVGYVVVDKERKQSPMTLEFDVTTNNARALSVVVTATEKEGNRNYVFYNVTPFRRSVEIGLGDVSLDGSTNTCTGSFSIALDNLMQDMTPEMMENYEWKVKIANMATYNGAEITYSNLRIVDKDLNVIYRSDESDYKMIEIEKFVALNKVL